MKQISGLDGWNALGRQMKTYMIACDYNGNNNSVNNLVVE